MKNKFLSVIIFLQLILPAIAPAEELEMINRPVNTSGLTGLLFTTAPYTVPIHSVELAAGVLSENSTVPNSVFSELPAVSLTAGLTDRVEASLRGSYLYRSVNGGAEKERGAGDTELSLKWNFLPQKESSISPSLALIVAGIVAGNSKITTSSIANWGAKLGLSAGSEISWGEHIFGLYGDADLIVHDLSGDHRDRYGMINAGILLPISKYRNLQMLLEYNLVSGIDRITAEGGDHSGITYGLRLVSDKFNLSFGTQFIHKSEPGFEKSTRVIGMSSIKF